MSRITKEEIEKTKCGRFLLSDENIYLSIYSLNSYVFEYNLLNTEDRILYHRLQDKFDARLINGVITRVREQIIELFDKDKYIEAKVYFKPKKLSENGELEFRPLHSTGLITQIAIVSMLHLFVYEIPEEEEGDPKLRLSNLSRLIPSDFYGNRVSVKPEYLFKPWKQQYQKYNQNSNDALMKYHTSLEYKYEVTLDLENFFPTINPIIIYRYIINHLPAYLNDEERKMMKRVLQKLLFCKLTTTFDEKTAGQYYKVTKGAGNYDNVDKIEQNEKECWAFKEKSDKFVRGIPQGLPQSYFLGNIYMISIAEIFRKKFTGVSYFYVDDSVIFTNDVREDNFKEQLKELNKQIADEANNFEDDSAIYPEGTEKFYKSDLYGVNVHLDGKSNYTRLDNLDDSEVYLKCISREMSQAGSDFFRMYSDEENRNLEEKLDVLSKQVKAKRDQLVEEKSQKRDDILIFRAEKTSSLPKDILGSNDVPEAAVEEANVFFLYRCCDKNSELYRMCKKLVDESNIRGNGHAIYQGIITEVENKINQLCVKNFNEMDTVIEDTVTAKAQSGDIDEMASLFNSVSFRDFVMTGYKQKCAITGNVIQYKSFMNLEAAHIWPRSHKGLYLPSNGIALCRDMHWAFDKGMFTIGDDFKIIVHPDVESDYLQQYNNKSLYIPENAFFRPDINNLHYHQTHIYGLFKTSGSLVKATGYYKNINMAAEDKTPYGSN